MTTFVLDTSVVMSWCLKDETDEYSVAILSRLSSDGALVPSLCPFEIVNVLLVAERRERLTEADSIRFVNLLEALPIHVDDVPSREVMASVLALGRQYGISAYDASYLELAVREGLRLATRDLMLKNAARKCGIKTI